MGKRRYERWGRTGEATRSLLLDEGVELEHRMGFEPMNTGFADQRVSHFAIGAHGASAVTRQKHGCIEEATPAAQPYEYTHSPS